MSTAIEQFANEITLFRHSKRSSWGLGILAFRSPERLSVQFEDGKLRTIDSAYVHLLDEVDKPSADDRDTVARLVEQVAQLPRPGHEGEGRSRASRATATGPTLSERLVAFDAAYAGGFQGELWTKEIRGEGQSRFLKKHREGFVSKGKILFERLATVTQSDEEALSFFDELVEVLDATDLTDKKRDIVPLEGLGRDDRIRLTRALVSFKNSPSDQALAVDRFLADIAPKIHPSWRLLSTLFFLLDPAKHLPVRINVLRPIARAWGENVRASTTPDGVQYDCFQRVGQQIKMALEQRGYSPRDMSDVADFLNMSK